MKERVTPILQTEAKGPCHLLRQMGASLKQEDWKHLHRKKRNISEESRH